MLMTVLAFLVTIGILVVIHEYGHYRAAVACGVKVQRFSVGFGKVIWSRMRGETEFVVSALPLGGYVKMLDEREGPVDPAERHRAFNRKPVSQRAFIVAAGPAANLLLAIALYAGVNWAGVQELSPWMAQPSAGSMAEESGLEAGHQVLAARMPGEDGQVAEWAPCDPCRICSGKSRRRHWRGAIWSWKSRVVIGWMPSRTAPSPFVCR